MVTVTCAPEALRAALIEEFLKGRSGNSGTPDSLLPEDARPIPPKNTLPRSGTETVVPTEKAENVGNWTTVPGCCAGAASATDKNSINHSQVLCHFIALPCLTRPTTATQPRRRDSTELVEVSRQAFGPTNNPSRRKTSAPDP